MRKMISKTSVDKKDTTQFCIKDVNEDGYEDIMAKFADVEGGFTKDDKIAILSGILNKGRFFYGKDSIRIVP